MSRAYPDRPVVGIGAVIHVSGEDASAHRLPGAGVVLIKRRYEPLAGEWSLPGGAVEVGETLHEAVAREVMEETGLRVRVGAVIEVFDRIMLDDRRCVQYHYVLIDYLCRVVGGTLQAGTDAADAAIVDPLALEPYRLTETAAAVIARGLALARAPEGGAGGVVA